ncbi:isocitrate lyase/PEP mutase family protein [Aurantiacibacter sp. D1-12]|uniref:isocitrate lyase/PEP mutase family protein n=1 Tax=Aurantiacibacter sp. D1-12 TaxID=2993658 RepID=UPI00237D0A91|nr:isocitrate lyase/phosphoenolpyruvate mutase family protein [Aurantiacibacter sp. D1-12]MDE1466353.1 isocitrate lyase/phosphoenolpyruvate mutase family protein [Aurantiacibacter sp. D1-12]
MTEQGFAALHSSVDPLVLFNIWDAGSARAVAKAGAKAIATGSHSVAGAQGFDDGEFLPWPLLVQTVRQIAEAVDLPLTVDIETGYAEDCEALAANGRELAALGVVGCNLEDRLFSGGMRDAGEQAERIGALSSTGLFVNARTDVFLGPLMEGDNPNRQELVDHALERAAVYADAGAGGLFVPGLSDPQMIAAVCQATPLPVNVMHLPGMVGNAELGRLGVARISHGPWPWKNAMSALEKAAQEAMQS